MLRVVTILPLVVGRGGQALLVEVGIESILTAPRMFTVRVALRLLATTGLIAIADRGLVPAAGELDEAGRAADALVHPPRAFEMRQGGGVIAAVGEGAGEDALVMG